MNYDILHQLIDKAQEYEVQVGQELQQEGIADFAKWLYEKTYKNNLQGQKASFQSTAGETLESIIGKCIGYMYRFSKFYVKKALENSPLRTLDDFTYLGSIFLRAGSTKTQIIDFHIHEKTTGTEILKRLKKNGFITEKKSETDARSKALFITEAGKSIFFAHVERMQKVGELIVGDLEESEKLQLVSLLNRLNDFHQPIYQENKKTDFDELLSFRK